MSLLLGFTGPPQRELSELMQATLAHRSRTPIARLELEGVTLVASLPDPQRATGIQVGGVARSGVHALAVSGYLLGEAPRSPDALLAAFLADGPSLFERLRGGWVLAAFGPEGLTLARDGAGIRTLYHATHAGRRWFAVEPKALTMLPGFPRRIRPASVAAYLSTGFVPGRHTMLETVQELEAGHCLVLDDRGERSTRWFRPEEAEEEGDPQRPEEEWVAEVAREHRRAVRERLPAGEPVAVFLSGGLDSSAVAAEVKGLHEGTVSTWSLHFGAEHPHELEYSRAVADRLATEHHELELRPRDFLPRLRRIAWYLDDPIGDPITVPNFELASRAGATSRWVFNGEGGDPVFGGPKNLPMLLHHWYGSAEENERSRARAYLATYRRGYEEWARLLAPLWRSEVDAARDLEGLFLPHLTAERPRSFLHRLSLTNQRTKGAHLILPKVDRMVGAAGLTPLAPLYDERLIRLSFAMPPSLKLRAGVEKVVLKRAFAGRLPESVLTRPKSGMRVPVHTWFEKGELRRYAERVLSRRELQRAGIFAPRRVEQFLRFDVEEGPGRYGIRLWMLLTFELWRRLVVEGEPV